MECPTQLPTSWWDWTVQVLVAAGTIGAVVVALFGDVLRHWFLPPRLRLSVDSLEGVPTPVQVTRIDVQGHATVTTAASRYWHVRVRNERRWLPAHNVQVLVLKIEMPGPDGLPQTKFEGETPMRWENQELYPSGRSVGASGRVALCSVVKDDGLGLHPIILPFSMPVKWTAPCVLWLTFQARADEGESPPMRVRVAWDGKWEDGALEMRQHLTLEVL